MTGLPVLRICLFEEPVFLIQMISGDFQCFTEPLEGIHRCCGLSALLPYLHTDL